MLSTSISICHHQASRTSLSFQTGSEIGTNTSTQNGTVYAQEILSGGRGPETTLYAFGGPPDLSEPASAPIFGYGALKGKLYGAACAGGLHQAGGVYQLDIGAGGAVTETVAYSFGNLPNDTAGCAHAQLAQKDFAGTLMGVADSGGLYGDGTFFTLQPPARPGTPWTETIVANFDSHDPAGGGKPSGTPLQIRKAVYGTLLKAQAGRGAVYRLIP